MSSTSAEAKVAAVCFLTLLLSSWVATAAPLTPVRVAFLTDCAMYSNWQSLAMIYSFKMSGQPGKLTRVMCCSEKDRATYPEALLKEVETHIAPSFTVHPVTGDNYAAYNKPEAVIDWLQHVYPDEEYILVLDSDMILRRPFLVEVMEPKPGLAIGARYTYMIGVNNELAMRHVPEVQPRNDTLAGPHGRRGDQVGGFFFYQRDDLKRMSTLWLKYTEDVRADPMAYKYSGDVYAIHPGDKPWISEMYGYAFGAAKADVWHKWDTFSMIYPQYTPSGIPKLMHYGLVYDVNGYKFDKHWHYNFDVTKCPPWDLSELMNRRMAGLFPHPPLPSTLTNKAQILEYYRDLLSLETVATMNAGFCDFHVRNCPPSKQLYDECKKAVEVYQALATESRRVEVEMGCADFNADCGKWQSEGQCLHNRDYMEQQCKRSCNVCTASDTIEGLAPVSTELEEKLAAMEKKLSGSQPDVTQESEGGVVTQDASPSSHIEPPVVEKAVVTAPVASPVVKAPVTDAPTPGVKSTRSRNELVIRCYRMALALEEVQDCVAAAKDQVEYQRPKSRGLGATGSSNSQHVAEAVHGTHDPDDLSLHLSKHVQPSLGTRNAMPAWETGFLVVLVVGAFVVVVPRLLRSRRRSKSGKRTE